jgi:hypothetical protein
VPAAADVLAVAPVVPGAAEAGAVADGTAEEAGLAAGVTVTVSLAPEAELSSLSPAALIDTVTQPSFAPLPQADTGGFPAQRPTRCPEESLTLTDADAGHRPLHATGTRTDADVTCVPLTPAPDSPENDSVPPPALPVPLAAAAPAGTHAPEASLRFTGTVYTRRV